MTHGVTTSIRLPSVLSSQLESVSRTLHKGKNWIITQALEEYLQKLESKTLKQEARRQSQLASQCDGNEQNDWENNTDTSGWT